MSAHVPGPHRKVCDDIPAKTRHATITKVPRKETPAETACLSLHLDCAVVSVRSTEFGPHKDRHKDRKVMEQ